MKSKFFVLMSAMLVTLALGLVVAAQSNRKLDPGIAATQRGKKVSLTCSPGGSKDVSTPLYVKNPTANDLPAGTLVFWSAQQGGNASGKQQLTAVLKKNSGNEVSLLGPPGGIGSCQAWVMQ